MYYKIIKLKNWFKDMIFLFFQEMKEPAEATLKDFSLDDTIKKMIDNMTELENLGQSVVMGRRTIIELDERRQKCREALRQLQKQAKINENKVI